MERELKSPASKERKQGKERKAAAHGGLSIPRYFTTPGVDPADEMAWEYRTAGITGEDGKVVFEQKNIEVPKTWSMLATNVVASKYFYGEQRTPERETSVRQLVHLLMSIWVEHQEYGKLLASENFHGGKHVKRSKLIGEMYQQIVDALTDLLKRGAAQGVFRPNIDPVDLYISISSLSAYYVAHQHTLNTIFHINVLQPKRLQQRENHIIDMILRYVRLYPDG